MVGNFNFAPTPKIIFGTGKLQSLPQVLASFGDSILLVTGKSSFLLSENWDQLKSTFAKSSINWKHIIIDREPTPQLIDDGVAKIKQQNIDVVVAIGGGSVIDAGKALSAMLKETNSIKHYLEGIGDKQLSGRKIPFIAIPTTSGTGAEATKNAVISEVGDNGFKKSLRHDNYVPNVALVDPLLTLSCPKSITAQSGMDAFTQLLESYVSTNSNAMTDALAVEGIRMIRDGLHTAVFDGSKIEGREKMSYSALISGITLANAGLGTVHGFASSIGGFYDIPHGLICARIMGPVNRVTVNKLKLHDRGGIGLRKYARIGKLFSKDKNKPDEYFIDILLDQIEQWTEEFNLRKLSEFGLSQSDYSKIISITGNKNNPVELDEGELMEVLGRVD